INEMPITLRRSQQLLLNTKATLLESAEAGGAKPAYGCRIGMCKTCSCTKVSGVVRDVITGAIDDQPNTQIRICVTEALSPVTLDI
ncbi:MAG: 2Fe-2S iron-sulfur cluster binding domain-containing protein, partial [Pseudomonadales bacterium]|nr:2Fe-2S iron-sulfur cluster binding domain-containing protein [Pseudomonadales bacterium]